MGLDRGRMHNLYLSYITVLQLCTCFEKETYAYCMEKTNTYLTAIVAMFTFLDVTSCVHVYSRSDNAYYNNMLNHRNCIATIAYSMFM